MEIWAIALLLIVGFGFWLIRGIRKTARMNDDPLQNVLYMQLAAASATELTSDRADAISAIEDAIYAANLTGSDLTDRMAHACSMIKTTGNIALYERSKRICDGIVRAWPERYSNQIRNRS